MATARQAVVQSVNPATGEVIREFALFDESSIDGSIREVHEAFSAWRDTSFAERAGAFRAAARVLRTKKERFAELITIEMGKPISQAESEIEKCAWNCEYYADNAPHFLEDIARASSATTSYISFEPLGPVLAIMPWNYPFWQFFRFAAPALMAGNTALLKHASNVPQCALAIEDVFHESGLPVGVQRTVIVSSAEVSKIIADPRVAAVTLTGSAAAGKAVGAAAGAALKKAVLELGGSDPFVVLEEADLESAAEFACRSRFQNTGESCIAAKRIIVVDQIAATFLSCLEAKVSALKCGDPMDRATDVGPMARLDLLDTLTRQVNESVAAGAKVVLGGRRLARRGFFYPPTILSDVTASMTVFREETFGPVAAVIRARDVENAIALANDTPYGLGADLWTQDIDRAKDLARRIIAGSVFINGIVVSDPRLPFGGVKASGYGRELSEFGIREFTNIKTVWIGPAIAAAPVSPSE